MKVLLTNDDGINAGGLIQLTRVLAQNVEVFVIAPRIEQSGVAQMITYRRPMFPRRLDSEVFGFEGYSVDGSPVDCIKLGLFDLCPWTPDLIVSGINGGLNAGTNVNNSGTVGGALTGANYGIPSIAVSAEWEPDGIDFGAASNITWTLLEKFASYSRPRTILNINIPTAALDGNAETIVCPVEPNLLGTHFDKGSDPKGRPYYWATVKPDPAPSEYMTDCQALADGKITVSPLTSDINLADAIVDVEALI